MRDFRFFVGLHHASDARHFDSAFVSVNALKDRKGDFEVRDWILDSGAFTTITKYGHYPENVASYAQRIERWSSCGTLLAAVTQDYMCDQFVLNITGLTVLDHQRLTIERYDELRAFDLPTYIMPVLQGYDSQDYVDHIRAYGDRLSEEAWVGVGSVCKRNANPLAIEQVLGAILRERPGLRLHGFGLKKTALGSSVVRSMLATADSMAWSFAARIQGRNGNDWREARRFVQDIEHRPMQIHLSGVLA